VRKFETGATRNLDHDKPDYEGYLSPRVLTAYGRYMLDHQIQADGARREGDNWQKGMPLEVFMKSGWRHFMEWWSSHRMPDADQAAELEKILCALLFNVMGYLHETLKGQEMMKKEPKNG
jgi:hypothetical protein